MRILGIVALGAALGSCAFQRAEIAQDAGSDGRLVKGGGSGLRGPCCKRLRYFRRERRQSPRSVADAEHAKAKAALLRLRIAEKQRELVPRANFDAVIDGIAGVVLSHLSGMAVRCSNDLVVRRKIDACMRAAKR